VIGGEREEEMPAMRKKPASRDAAKSYDRSDRDMQNLN
jgi:hypothetical protein